MTYTSTINPNIPVSNAPVAAAPMRNNFLAAYNDVTALASLIGNGTVQWYQIQNGVDNATPFNALVQSVSAAGGGTIYVSPGDCTNSRFIPASNVTIIGSGASTIFRANFNGFFFTNTTIPTQNITNFRISSCHFIGGVTNTPSVPTRARTAGTGMLTALFLQGSLDPAAPVGAGVISNITFDNNIVENCAQLPILLSGCSGNVNVYNNIFNNNQDVGFKFNQEAKFHGNHIVNSADNGVSLSRGNTNVSCVGNTVQNACFNGIWVSGFGTDAGPSHFAVTGNVVNICGQSGVCGELAPTNGVITGNDLYGGYYRGPVDQVTNVNCSGVYLGGIPDQSNSPTTFSTGIIVSTNHIKAFPRAGIYSCGSIKQVGMTGNVIEDIGTQFLADGVTPILSSDITQNVGILIENASNAQNIFTNGNVITDTRGTPYCNFPINPSNLGANVINKNIYTSGLRGSFSVLETGPTVTHQETHVFNVNIKFPGGATSGSTGGTGTISGFDTNGAAGSIRFNNILSGANKRWSAGGNSVAESGSNVGTDYCLARYDDTGTLVGNMLQLTRDGKIGFTGVSPVALQTLPAVATDLASVITLANGIRTALIALGLGQ